MATTSDVDQIQPSTTRDGESYVSHRDDIHFTMTGDFMTGVDFWIHATGETTSGQLIVIETNWVRGTEPVWHIHHREEEGFFVMDGEIVIHTEAGSYSAKKGQFVWGRKDQRHTYEVVGEEARILVVFVPGPNSKGFEPDGGIDKYFYEARDRELRTPEQLQAEVENLKTNYGLEMFPEMPHPRDRKADA
jgi:quercetin dioxygenase-like cupin family protein